MSKRILSLLLVVLAVLLAATTVVSADAPAPQPDDPPARLHARGDGIAGLKGSEIVQVSGNGMLWINGAERVQITGQGIRKTFPDGWVEYIGFHGEARIAGVGMTVVVAGEHVDLDAIGHGRALMWGKGVYQINENSARSWQGLDDIALF